MKDYLGNDLNVGDKVVYIFGKYKNFYKGTVLHILPKMVRVTTMHGYLSEPHVIAPQQVIKIDWEDNV